jgi:fatty acid synthase
MLLESHIGSFIVNSFERVIRKETKGRGVDIILCSPMGEKLETFVSCLARGGTFVEIGRCDSDYERSFDLHLLEKESSYRGVMLDALFGESSEVKKKLIKSVAEGIKCGYVKPLPANVFGHDEIEKAFRYMTMGEHTGKVLIKFREENESLVGTSDRLLLEAVPR